MYQFVVSLHLTGLRLVELFVSDCLHLYLFRIELTSDFTSL